MNQELRVLTLSSPGGLRRPCSEPALRCNAAEKNRFPALQRAMATLQTSLQLGGRESDALLGNQVPRVTFFTKNTSHPKRSLQLGPWTRSVTAE